MARYAERDDLVDAVQWRPGVSHTALLDLGHATNVAFGGRPMEAGMYISTAQGPKRLYAGIYIVTDQWGDVSLMSPAEFHAAYVRVLDASHPQ